MRKTNVVKVGTVLIGGGHGVSVQSMLSVPAWDIKSSVAQAVALEQAGCQIIRAAVPNMEAVELIRELKKNVTVPVVADIHFDYRLALESVKAGVDKIRINPGNIGGEDRIKAVADSCKAAGVPIRIGVNSGSLEKHILLKYGTPTPEALVESASYHAKLLEKYDFHNIIISLKSSDVKFMLDSYRMAAELFAYPLHLGVTEAGTERMGLIKSSIGIGSLLADGIGDTIRVSLTADPIKEIAAAKDILKAVGASGSGARVISCPTCGRTGIDLIKMANQVEALLADCKKDIKVAVMGCEVNGPGEAKEADIGIAGGKGEGLIFKKGVIIAKVPEDKLVSTLMSMIEEL